MSPDRARLIYRRGGAATTCLGKEPFETKALADSVCQRSLLRRDGNLATYRCLVCRKYHLGSTTGPRNRLNSGNHKRALQDLREEEKAE